MREKGERNVRALVLLGTLTVILTPSAFADDVIPQTSTIPKVEPSSSVPPVETPPSQNATTVEATKPAQGEPVKEKAAVTPKTKTSEAHKSQATPATSAFVNGFLNPQASSTSVPQKKAKAAQATQATRSTQSRAVVPAYNYGTAQRSVGTYNYAGGNNSRFNSGFANNGGFQTGNNARPGSLPRLGPMTAAPFLNNRATGLGEQLMREQRQQRELNERFHSK